MKKVLYINIAILLTIFVSSCSEDFLNQPPRGALTAGNFPSTQEDARLATNAIYNALRMWHINTGGFPILDIMSDEATKGSNPGDGTAVRPYDNFTHTPVEGSVERYYKDMYQAIRRANLVINLVPEIEDIDPDLRDSYLAQARFLRGYFYGHLIRIFGDVPLVTEVYPSLDLKRTDAQIVLNDLVIPDLEYAIAILPEKSDLSSSEYGRATKGAARGLLARIYMYFGDFTNAEIHLKDIVESEEYELETEFGNAFSEMHEHGVESIFEVTATEGSFALGGNQYANTQGIRGGPNRGWGFCRPAYSWISKLQDEEDPRLDPSVIFLGEVLGGLETTGDSTTPDTTYENGQIVEIECYNQKVWHSGAGTLQSFDYNRRIIRYADVLLMYAEALNENGKSSDALIYLNEVRQRARGNNPDILPEITTTNQDELSDIIMEERHRELAIEGLRFWDLVRTDRAEEVLGPLGFQSNKNELLPIPQSEIDLSEGRFSQNPGY